MSTDSLQNFSYLEKEIWDDFVLYQDAMSSSALTTDVDAIGCSVEDELGNSYVVTEDGITTVLCQSPALTITNILRSESLDRYFMALYNCEEPEDCERIYIELTDVSPCLI